MEAIQVVAVLAHSVRVAKVNVLMAPAVPVLTLCARGREANVLEIMLVVRTAPYAMSRLKILIAVLITVVLLVISAIQGQINAYYPPPAVLRANVPAD